MNALLAAPLGIAAALVATSADATVQEENLPPPAPVVPPGAELLTSAPAPDLLAPELAAATARLEAADPLPICDDKCQVIALAEAILPNTGVANLVSVALEPEEHTLNIPSSDGLPALTIKIDPSKAKRGEAVVATAKF